MAKASAITTDRRCGQDVEIIAGSAEFIGKTGRIQQKQGSR
jgi:hypothetical protein